MPRFKSESIVPMNLNNNHNIDNDCNASIEKHEENIKVLEQMEEEYDSIEGIAKAEKLKQASEMPEWVSSAQQVGTRSRRAHLRQRQAAFAQGGREAVSLYRPGQRGGVVNAVGELAWPAHVIHLDPHIPWTVPQFQSEDLEQAGFIYF